MTSVSGLGLALLTGWSKLRWHTSLVMHASSTEGPSLGEGLVGAGPKSQGKGDSAGRNATSTQAVGTKERRPSKHVRHIQGGEAKETEAAERRW